MNKNEIKTNWFLAQVAERCLFKLAFIILSAFVCCFFAGAAYAWGPSSPSGSQWVTGNGAGAAGPATCTFTWDTSGIYDFNNVNYEIVNGGTSINTTTGGKSFSVNYNLNNETNTSGSYWRVQFYKWDGVDMYGNPTGAIGWTGWSGWAYFGVDFKKPGTGSKIFPGNAANLSTGANYYLKNPVTISWNAGNDSMSGVKNYVVTGSFASQTSTVTNKPMPALAQGLHNYQITVRDNSYANAFDSSTHWETIFTDASRNFFIDDFPPAPGVKTTPPNSFAINPDANGTTCIGGFNAYNPSPYTTANKVNLNWSAATDGGSGVDHYNISVSSGAGPRVYTVMAPTTGFVLGSVADVYSTLPSGDYYWNITAFDKSGNSSIYGADFKVVIDRNAPNVGTKTSPNIPGAGSYTNNPTISFNWALSSDPGGSGVNYYDLCIAPVASGYTTSLNCGTAVTKSQNISGAPFNFASEGRYKWNIKAYDRAMNYQWYSTDYEFIYDKTPPQAGNKVFPFWNPSGKLYCTNSTTVNFSWTAATDLPAGAPAGINHYELYIDGVMKYTGTALSATIGGLTQGIHSWNIKVFDNANNFVFYDQSGVIDWQFKIDLTNPTAGNKVMPANNFKTNSTSITFNWGDSNDSGAGASGVDRIDLIVNGPVTFTVNDVKKRWARDASSTDYSTSPFGSATYTASGLTDGVYTWNVRAWDRAGNFSIYDGGVDWKFTIDSTPPVAGVKVSPVNMTITNNNLVKFDWTAASDNVSAPASMKYVLYIDGGPFSPMLLNTLTYTAPTPLAEGDHTWNVRVYDEAGNFTNYGGSWTIKIDTVKPDVGTLYAIKGVGLTFVAPDASGVDVDSGTPKFAWKPSTDPSPGYGIDKYRLVIEIPKLTIKYDSGYTIADLADAEFAPSVGFKLPDANKLADDGPYYWTIYVRDVAGNIAQYPVQWNFYVDTLLLNEISQYNLLVSRANGMVPATTGSPATYQPSPAYEINLMTTLNTYTCTADIVPDAPTVANNYGTTYYWSVMNQDISGMWGKYEDYSVNIVTLLPGSLVKPVDKSLSPIKPKFEWSHSMPQGVRRMYRVVAYANAWLSGAPVVNWSTPWSDIGDLPTTYQTPTNLADGKYYWSVYATNDMTQEVKYPQTWSFEIVRKPFVNMASTNLKWYAGYVNGIYVDAFGANGYDTLGTCEVTLFKDAAGTQPIRKFTLPTTSSLPAKMSILDGDAFNRVDPVTKLYTLKSFTYVDNVNYPSNKRYVMNAAARYNYLPNYPANIYARARVYFYDINNPADMSVYTDYPSATTTNLVGEVNNSLKMRPFDSGAADDTASVFFAYGMVDSKKNYKFLKPSMVQPPDTLQYRNDAPEYSESPFLFFNGASYMESPHGASFKPLSAADASRQVDGSGNPLVWRITKYQNNSFDTAMRLRLFKDPDYTPQNTYDFMKILGEYNGTTPVEVITTPEDYVSAGSAAALMGIWNQLDVDHCLDRGETPTGSDPNANTDTLTKFETWFYASSGDNYKLTYSADMYSHVFLNGEPLPDDYNIYNMDEIQRRNRIEVPFSGSGITTLAGWNHLVIYVLHKKKIGTNGVNGLCYRLEGVSRVEAFGGTYSMDLWRAHPIPEPNYYDFANNGRGTSFVVYKQIKNASNALEDVVAANKSGTSPAIYGLHKGLFFADKNALDTIVASKPVEGGDHKMSVGLVSNESLVNLESRFSTSTFGENGYIKIHVNQTPYSPENVKRIWANPRFVCNDPYLDVESVNTLTPTIAINEAQKIDPDNPSESYGFHHSMYNLNDYLPAYTAVPSIRTDEVRYVYVLSENEILEKFSSLLFGGITYKAPLLLTNNYTDYMPASHLIPAPVLQESRNIAGTLTHVYNYRVWSKDEHGELQNIGSPVKRFVCDMRPPVVADINVYYDREGGVRLDGDVSPFVENDKTEFGTNSIALVGHTITLWAFCTDEITADPRRFNNGKFLIRRSGSADPWLDIDATCEVDIDILFEDIRYAFNRVPSNHPNGYYWYAFYTIPYNADLSFYDVDFQIDDAVGNRSKMLSDASNDAAYQALAKNQFRVSTMRLNNATIVPTLRTTTINVTWLPFRDLRDYNPVDHYIVAMGDLTPNPFETSNWVAGDQLACTREVRTEGKLPVFIIPVEKIGTVGFGTDFNDFIFSFEDPNSKTNFMDGWREEVPNDKGGYFSADVKKVKEGMYSWSNFAKAVPGEYKFYKDFNIGSNIKVAFGAWIKKELLTSKTKLQIVCFDSNNAVINPNANGVTYETSWDSVKTNSWVHYYLRNLTDQKPYFITPLATQKIRLIVLADSGSKIYLDQAGFASFSEVTVDFTPPQKPDVQRGVVNNHLNTGNSATVYGYWDGQWDIKGMAWLDEPTNFPTLLAANVVDFFATKEQKKVGQYSYKVINPNATAVGYFGNADIKLNVESGDVLRVWAYLQSNGKANAVRNIKNIGIAISDGTSWDARVCFGDDTASMNQAFIDKGLTTETAIIKLGGTPETGKWIPLDIPISTVGLEGRQIAGMAFAIDGTYEASVIPPATPDTVEAFIDFIDIDCGAGVKNYLPQLEKDQNNDFKDFSNMRTADGTIESGFMTSALFDDDEFTAAGLETSSVAFTDKKSVFVGSKSGGTTYSRPWAYEGMEFSGIHSVSVSNKLKCVWPADSRSEIDYNGGAIVVWTLVKNADSGRDNLSELNIGVEYSTLSEASLMTIAKYRGATLSPRSRKPVEFTYTRSKKDLLIDELRANALLIATNSLYKMSDSFETTLTGSGLTFHKNFIDASKLPDVDGEWRPLVIPISSIVPESAINYNSGAVVTIKNLYVEATNCDVYVDYIGKVTSFKQFGDWQENMNSRKFVNDLSQLTYDEIHNAEQSIDGSESIKIKKVGVGHKSFNIKLVEAHGDIPPDIPPFDPAPFYLDVPATGGVFSLNLYLGTNEALLPGQFMIEFHRAGDAPGVYNYRAFWGSDYINVGVSANDVPDHYYVGALPDVRGGWSELLIPSGILNMNGQKFDSINVRGYSKVASGFEFWIDRIGMLGIVPHIGEAKKHSIYSWNREDYMFYSMRVKSWDKVLNESEYAYSRYVFAEDRTPPIIQSQMSPLVNYQGMKVKVPMGGLTYIKDMGAGVTAEVPLFFTDDGTPTGNYDSAKEVDLSTTIEETINMSTVNSSDGMDNKVWLKNRKFKDGKIANVAATLLTAYDPQPSADELGDTEWEPDIEGYGQTHKKFKPLNYPSIVPLADNEFKRYVATRYFFMDRFNYIVRPVVYDIKKNFAIPDETYVDITPGALKKLQFYYPSRNTIIDVKASESAKLVGTAPGHKDEINPATKSWVGVSARDGMNNPVRKDVKVKLSWRGLYKGPKNPTLNMNLTQAETVRRMHITPLTGALDPARPWRTYYEPPPRPYFQIDRSSSSVELASKMLTPGQVASGAVTYCTQEVQIWAYTGYNIKGEAYEIGIGAKPIASNMSVAPSDPNAYISSGSLEAYFTTTTHAGDKFTIYAESEDGSVRTDYAANIQVSASGLAEMQVDPPEAEIDAESGQATFVVKGFDQFRNRENYKPKYHTIDSFLIDYFAEDEKATYEYLATNEIVISPLWTTDSHEVAYNNGKYEIENGETVGTFLSEGRTSSNTFGAGWEQGTKSIYIIDTTDIMITDAFGSMVNAAATYTGAKFLSSGAELRYGLQSLPKGKGWDINKSDVFITSFAKVFVRPLMKGYIGFRVGTEEVDMKRGGVTAAAMNAVLDNSDLTDSLKLSIQTFDDHNQATSYDSMTEVIVRLDTNEDEFARLHRWPVTDLAKGAMELKVRLDRGSAEVGITAHNSRLKPRVKLYSLNPNYKDITVSNISELKIDVYPNKLDHLYFDPVITNDKERFAVVKGKTHPLRAYGYDYRGNPIEPLDYQPTGWMVTSGILESQSRTPSHLDVIFNARDLVPAAGTNIPVDVTVNAQARFKKLAGEKGSATREVGVDYKRSEVGYLQVVNFGLMPFPCVYQVLDKEKLDKEGEYELSFVYMTGDAPGDARPAIPKIGLAFSKDGNSVPTTDIYLLYGKPLCTNGEWSKTPMKLRFKMDGAEKSESGTPGVNNLGAAKKVILFLGAPESNTARPAIRFDHVTVERVN